jgi:hypothetical protein
MRFLALAYLMSMVLLACGGGGDDDGGSDDGPDAAPLPLCTGAVYDSCTDTAGGSDCDDGLQCHVYDMAGITLCVPACDADNPCPDQDGVEVRCNTMGRCRPDVANECMVE